MREHTEEAEPVGERPRRGAGEVAEVAVQVAGELAAFLACASYGDAGAGDGEDAFWWAKGQSVYGACLGNYLIKGPLACFLPQTGQTDQLTSPLLP